MNINVIKNQYNPDVFDIVKIENGSDKKGIYNFLGSTFYLNGACGVKVIYDNFKGFDFFCFLSLLLFDQPAE